MTSIPTETCLRYTISGVPWYVGRRRLDLSCVPESSCGRKDIPHMLPQKSQERTLQMLNVYAGFLEEVLAVPRSGTEDREEKFAGASAVWVAVPAGAPSRSSVSLIAVPPKARAIRHAAVSGQCMLCVPFLPAQELWRHGKVWSPSP